MIVLSVSICVVIRKQRAKESQETIPSEKKETLKPGPPRLMCTTFSCREGPHLDTVDGSGMVLLMYNSEGNRDRIGKDGIEKMAQSVINVSHKLWEPEFKARNPHTKLSTVARTLITVLGRQRLGDPGSIFSSQPSLLSDP